MKHFIVHQNLQRVENAFALIEVIPFESEARAHYAKYLCVLCSGYIESSIRIILSSYAEKTAIKTSGYVSAQLRQFQNPNVEAIRQLIERFDNSWCESFLNSIEGAPADSVNSIVGNRHQIAHGENTGITFHTIKEYFEHAKEVVALIDDNFHCP